MAVLIAELTTFGAINSPNKNCLFNPSDGPTSLASPATFSRSEHKCIKFWQDFILWVLMLMVVVITILLISIIIYCVILFI